jgi:hypothetical protein
MTFGCKREAKPGWRVCEICLDSKTLPIIKDWPTTGRQSFRRSS